MHKMIDTDAEICNGKPVCENHITKTLVLYYLVLRGEMEGEMDDGGDWVEHIPMTQGDAEGDRSSICHDTVVIGVIPAPAGTYEVSGVDCHHQNTRLGQEHPGVAHPDWVDELLKWRRREVARHRELVESGQLENVEIWAKKLGL